MNSRYIKLYRATKLLSVVAVALFLGFFCINGKNANCTELSVKEQLSAVVKALESNASYTEYVLKQLGFPPNSLDFSNEIWANYKKWPDVRKLEAAYYSAEQASKGSGERLLKDVMMLTAKHNVSIKESASFKEAIGELTPDSLKTFRPDKYSYVKVPVETIKQPLPPKVEKMVRAVADHSRRIPGGIPNLVKACCGINNSQAYKQMRSASSLEEVLRWALANGELPPELERRVSQFLEYSTKNNIALTYDKALSGYSNELKQLIVSPTESAREELVKLIDQDITPRVYGEDDAIGLTKILKEAQGADPPPAVVRQFVQSVGHTGGTGVEFAVQASTELAAHSFSGFQAREYGVRPTSAVSDTKVAKVGNRAKKLGFSKIRVSSRGFGGVVLGNTVKAKRTLPKPIWVEWKPVDNLSGKPTLFSADESWGVFVVRFEDDTIGYTKPIRKSHAWAALSVVFTGIPGVTSPLFVGDGTDGEAVGLAGFTGRNSFFYLENDLVVEKENAVLTFVVHPSISNLNLGQSALMVDAVPFNFQDYLNQRAVQAIENNEINGLVDDAKELFENWLGDRDRATYKFIDVELDVDRTDKGVIYVERHDDGKYSENIRKSVFLDFQKFDSSREPVSVQKSPPFYPIAPVLIKIWPDFERLNDFAEILAIVRWLKVYDAALIGEIDQPSQNIPKTSLVLDPRIGPRLDQSLYEMRLNLAREVHERSKEIISQNGFSEFLVVNDEIHQTRLRRLHIDQALDQFNIEAISSSDNVSTMSEIQGKCLYYERIRSVTDGLSASELVKMFKIDIPGELSQSDAKRLKNEIHDDISKTLSECKRELRKVTRDVYDTPEGKYVKRLESLKNDIYISGILDSAESILSEKVIKRERDKGGSELVKLKEMSDSLGENIAYLNLSIEELRNIENTTDSKDLESEKIEIILNHVATNEEKISFEQLTKGIDKSQSTINNEETGFIKRIKTRWTMRKLVKRQEALLTSFQSTKRINATRNSINKEIESLNIAKKKIEQKFKDQIVVVVNDIFPLFDRWLNLQKSFNKKTF